MLELEFLALLGDTDITSLKLESPTWSDTNIATTLHDGPFRLKGPCIAGSPVWLGSPGASR